MFEMGEWPFWMVGATLAAAMITHYLVTRRMFAGSGRITALVDRVRQGPINEPEMSEEELVAALRAATLEAFGDDAVSTPPPQEPTTPLPPLPPRMHIFDHGLFLFGLVLGGALAAFTSGGLTVTTQVPGTLFSQIFGDSPVVAVAVMLVGGVFVGFGTRMAGGCTTGHGFCGVSRFQPGSLVSTGAFFGAGVVVSLILGVFL
jgi:uncharacterized membrane protein YedE/YeeE